MFSRARSRFGTAGLVIAVIALIAALAGGAYAASGGLTGKQKKEVKKIAKEVAIPGPAGGAGAKGDIGLQGPEGKQGSAGIQGIHGKNVKLGTATSGAGQECPQVGGVTVEVEGEAVTKKHVCNGSPWSAGGTLPSNATETGMWSFATPFVSGTGVTYESHTQFVSFNFSVPLTAALEEAQVIYVAAPGEHATECPGTVEEPKATAGNLCVYKQFAANAAAPTLSVGSTAGSVLGFDPVNVEESMFGFGSWAVTAQ